MTDWEPATEAEAAMREALRGEDQENYFQILARTELLLPVSGDGSNGAAMGWGTWTTGGRTHVLAFSSPASLQACLAQHAGSTRLVPFQELAASWPNVEWWLAVNPGLPIEGYLPAWFVAQLARGDVRLPGRTMGARARLAKAESANRARATASVPGMTRPSQDEVAAAMATPAAHSPGTLSGTGLLTSSEPSPGIQRPAAPPPPGLTPQREEQVSPSRWAASPESSGWGAGTSPDLQAGGRQAEPAAPAEPPVGPGGLPRRQASSAVGPTVYGGAVPVDRAADYLRGANQDGDLPVNGAGAAPAGAYAAPALPAERETSSPFPAEPQQPEPQQADPERSGGWQPESQRSGGWQPEPDRSGGWQTDSERSGGWQPESERSGGWQPEPDRSGGWQAEPEQSGGWRPEAEQPGGWQPEAQRSEAQQADAQQADGQQAEAQRPAAQRSESERSETQWSETQWSETQWSETQWSETSRSETPHFEAQRSESHWSQARPAEAQQSGAQQAEAQQAEARESEARQSPVAPADVRPEVPFAQPEAVRPEAARPDAGAEEWQFEAQPGAAAQPERRVWAAPGEAPAYEAPTYDPDAQPYSADLAASPAPSPAYRPESQIVPPPDLAGFVAANEVEEDLLAAAGDGSTDSFLSTLLLARVLLPLKPGTLPGPRPGDPGFAWRTDVIDDERYVVVFTSPERLAEHLEFGEQVETVSVKFAHLIRHWPDPGLSFAVNPGSPVGATLPGSQIVALASWAKDVGLGEDGDVEPAEEPVEPAAPVRATRPAPATRSGAPDPALPTVMQKTVAPAQVDYFLTRGYDRVSGFVHRANEVEHLNSPGMLLAALGLLYPGSEYRSDQEEVHVLRWPAYRPSLYRIPYGGQNEAAMRAMEGWVIERPPFRGNGFAPGESSDVIAEFKVDSARLPHGSELWSIDRYGKQTLIAILDTDAMTWRRVDGSA